MIEEQKAKRSSVSTSAAFTSFTKRRTINVIEEDEHSRVRGVVSASN